MSTRDAFPPSIENASKLAVVCVKTIRDLHEVCLDYSPSTLYLIDDILENLRDEGCSPNDFRETLYAFGCYFGEVFVRSANGVWVHAQDTILRYNAGNPLLIQLPNGRLCEPIAKVFWRLHYGRQDHLPTYYAAFTGQCAPEPSTDDKRRWWKGK